VALNGAPGAASASPRLYAYAAAGAAGLVLGLAGARPGLAAYGAPLAVLALAGVALARGPRLVLRAHWEPARALAGDELTLVVDGRIDPAAGRLVLLAEHSGPAVARGPDRSLSTVVTVEPDVSRRLRARTDGWGLVRVHQIVAEAHGPLGLVRWSWTIPATPTARLLPQPEALPAMLDPEARATAGSHPSRARGGGIDIAELRPLVPGDRLADVNWLASARRPSIQPGLAPGALDLVVTARHPERTGDVVLLFDTLADDRVDAAPWLRTTAQAAWTVVRAHLGVQDRVGLVALGGYPQWVAPGVGRKAQYALLDALLRVHASWSAVDRTLTGTPARLLPPGALVIAVSPLHDRRFVDAAIDLRRQGRDVAALVFDASRWLPPLVGTSALAARLWALELEVRVDALERAGIPTVRWRDGQPVGSAVALLSRRRRAPVRVRR
jgi:uncharacterized protein (DUF58 family)